MFAGLHQIPPRPVAKSVQLLQHLGPVAVEPIDARVRGPVQVVNVVLNDLPLRAAVKAESLACIEVKLDYCFVSEPCLLQTKRLAASTGADLKAGQPAHSCPGARCMGSFCPRAPTFAVGHANPGHHEAKVSTRSS